MVLEMCVDERRVGISAFSCLSLYQLLASVTGIRSFCDMLNHCLLLPHILSLSTRHLT